MPEPPLLNELLSDQRNYYSADSLTKLGAGFLAGGIMANTSIDEGIQKHFRASVRGATSDDWFETLHANRELGNGRYTLPVFAVAWAGGQLMEGLPGAEPASEWGERSLRAVLVGAPPMLAMQLVTGASRPGETNAGSAWAPFQDNNGVSGHSFMGAIPFLCAAHTAENPLLKTLFYAGSTLAPLSRVNDDAHYSSQALLGWWMAWIAATAVDRTSRDSSGNWDFVPFPDPSISGLAIRWTW